MLLFFNLHVHVCFSILMTTKKRFTLSDYDDNVEGPHCTADVLRQLSCEL